MLKSTQRLINADARNLSFLPDNSVHLVITSPPYWNLKKYNEHPQQLGHIDDYATFLNELKKVWQEVWRLLVPGGRLICVVGDVCVARKKFGRHKVFPLHADICVACQQIGFDNLNPILWHKIANASFEVENGVKFLGKPYEPNGIIKNDIEYILMQRKPGGYRRPTKTQRALSKINKSDFTEWFQQIWTLPGASTRDHPAPFPYELAQRLTRMFSFVGDTIIDPFCGTGTTLIAALKTQRNAIGIELDREYCKQAARRLKTENETSPIAIDLLFEKAQYSKKKQNKVAQVEEDSALYQVRNNHPKRRIKRNKAIEALREIAV